MQIAVYCSGIRRSANGKSGSEWGSGMRSKENSRNGRNEKSAFE